MARLVAPVSLVRGQVKVFVNDLTTLEKVIKALDGDRGGTFGHLEALAAASGAILDAAATCFPDARIRGLKDVVYHGRGKLQDKLRKKIEALNSAYSFLRHTAASEVEGLAKQVVDDLLALSKQGEDVSREQKRSETEICRVPSTFGGDVLGQAGPSGGWPG